MSFVDEIKSLFHIKADEFGERLGAIEARLSDIAKSSDQTARQLDYEILNVRLNEIDATNLREVLQVPPGSFYVLMHWAWLCNAIAVKPALQVNGMVIDGAVGGSSKVGASNPNELVLLENETLFARNIEGDNFTTYFLQFRVYKKQPKMVTRTGEGG